MSSGRELIASLVLLSIATIGSVGAAGLEPKAGEGQVEHIWGVQITPKGLVFQVFSGGCTKKKDFKVEIMESYPVQILLVRVKPDPCDAFVPMGKKIRFKWRQLGLQAGNEFSVVNPRAVLSVPFH